MTKEHAALKELAEKAMADAAKNGGIYIDDKYLLARGVEDLLRANEKLVEALKWIGDEIAQNPGYVARKALREAGVE